MLLSYLAAEFPRPVELVEGSFTMDYGPIYLYIYIYIDSIHIVCIQSVSTSELQANQAFFKQYHVFDVPFLQRGYFRFLCDLDRPCRLLAAKEQLTSANAVDDTLDDCMVSGWRPKRMIEFRQNKVCIVIWLVVSNMFDFQPYLGKIPIFTNIFQMGWNHQPVMNDVARWNFGNIYQVQFRRSSWENCFQ